MKRTWALGLQAAVLWLAVGAGPAAGQTVFTWNNSTVGLFNDPVHWLFSGSNPGPPGPGHTGSFNRIETHTVVLTTPVNNATWRFSSSGTATLELGGQTHTLTSLLQV